jgi:hypothetical protein
MALLIRSDNLYISTSPASSTDNAALRCGVDTPLNHHVVQLRTDDRVVFIITDQLGDEVFYSA